METAVEFLIEKLDNNLDIKHSWRTKQYIEQAKEMEKQQIIDTYIEASPRLEDITKESAEQYYNETFKTE
jgi:HEPN domain-containing protein